MKATTGGGYFCLAEYGKQNEKRQNGWKHQNRVVGISVGQNMENRMKKDRMVGGNRTGWWGFCWAEYGKQNEKRQNGLKQQNRVLCISVGQNMEKRMKKDRMVGSNRR